MRLDFMQAMESTGVSTQVAERIVNRFFNLVPQWFSCIDDSFISDEQKAKYKELILQRIKVLQQS